MDDGIGHGLSTWADQKSGDELGDGVEGEFVVIPKGVEHLPIAEDEVHVLLLEPKSTLNTGNVQNERTVSDPEWI
jgi:mannose-6-phosphate isomerase-like protein (cupin superfamily)